MEATFRQTVTEADLDWIVCVELNANSAFRDWFSTILFGCCVTHQGAWRSVADILGESDLIWHAAFPDGTTHFALIENKINAVAQPEQHDRYVSRGNKYVADNKV